MAWPTPRCCRRLPGRVLLAVVISALILVAVTGSSRAAWTRPLEQLCQRMQSHRLAGARVTAAPIAGASSEVVAIAVAHDDCCCSAATSATSERQGLLLVGVSHDLCSSLARIRMAAALLPETRPGALAREAIARNTEVVDRLIGSSTR